MSLIYEVVTNTQTLHMPAQWAESDEVLWLKGNHRTQPLHSPGIIQILEISLSILTTASLILGIKFF